MATRYHISDSGTPAVCRAKSTDSCPKTKAGDGFHGDLEEATRESERRFGESYGATVTLSSPKQKESWNLAADKLSRENAAIMRAKFDGNLSDLNAANAEVFARTKQGLSRIHGVDPADVSATPEHYIVTEKDGTRRVYGPSRKSDLSYLGVLHPQLTQPATFASEHRAMIGNREPKEHELHALNPSISYYGYGSVALKGIGTVEFTTDAENNPVDKQVWNSVDAAKVPKALFEDESLRRSIRNGGIISD